MTKVLHRDRNAMQGTTNCATGDLGVSPPRLSQRQIGSKGHVAFQAAIEPGDTIGYLPYAMLMN